MTMQQGGYSLREATGGDGETLTLPVEGMTCASCVLRVEKALQKIDGVSTVAVNLATEKATISFDPARVSLAMLRENVARAGYTLGLPEMETTAASVGKPEAASRVLKRDLLLSAALTVPVMLLSMLSMAGWFHALLPLSMEDVNKILLLLTTPIMFFPARRFFRGFWTAARHLTADMNTLVAVGTGSAYLYSTASVLFPSLLGASALEGKVYFDTASTIITLILFGKFLELRAKRRASDAIQSLLRLQPSMARILLDDQEKDVPVSSVSLGDIVIIRPGERVPVDAVITKGSTTLDESMVTGESLPVEKTVGDRLIGGTINRNGSVECRATAVGARTVLAQIVRMVETAQGSKAPIQTLADRIASVFVPTIIVVAALTFLGWYFLAGVPFTHALVNFIAVLIIACPCALGLATPTAIMVGTGVAASHGILIRNADSLERARTITTVVLDKTGTVTEGKPSVTDVVPDKTIERERLLAFAAALERQSEHPLAEAVVAHARASLQEIPPADSFRSLTGLGVAGSVDGHGVIAGSGAIMSETGVDISVYDTLVETLAGEGKTILFVAVDGHAAGLIGLSDRIKPSSADAVRSLRKMGIAVVLLTGDNERAAHAIASQAGIERVIASILPAGKADEIRRLQSQGEVVAMVGDGINDAPALAQADVGIALGTGTDIAIEAADITLMQGDLASLVRAIDMSSRTLAAIRQNLFWAFIYNVVGVPLAALGLLSPVIAAAAMAFSSVSVVSNSLRLRRFRP